MLNLTKTFRLCSHQFSKEQINADCETSGDPAYFSWNNCRKLQMNTSSAFLHVLFHGIWVATIDSIYMTSQQAFHHDVHLASNRKHCKQQCVVRPLLTFWTKSRHLRLKSPLKSVKCHIHTLFMFAKTYQTPQIGAHEDWRAVKRK